MTVFFADLDRTLIYSTDALWLGVQDRDAPALTCVETYNGRQASFVTEGAARGIERLLTAGMLVPVTTRSVDQYRRVRLPGPLPRLALVANGGLLLRSGNLDEDYRQETTERLAGSTPLNVVFAHLQAVADPRFSINLRTVEDLFCYAVVDANAVPRSWAVQLADYAASVGWQVSDQGRKVYLLPDKLSKGQAVERIADELNLQGFIAAGDTNTDVPMLHAASAAMIPRHAPLVRHAEELGVSITQSAGVAAGEELVTWAESHLLHGRRPHQGAPT